VYLIEIYKEMFSKSSLLKYVWWGVVMSPLFCNLTGRIDFYGLNHHIRWTSSNYKRV